MTSKALEDLLKLILTYFTVKRLLQMLTVIIAKIPATEHIKYYAFIAKELRRIAQINPEDFK